MRKRAIIVDIDGTIADISHRLRFLEGKKPKEKDWDGFYRACTEDKPIMDMIDLVETVRLGGGQGQYHCIFLTGRSDRVRTETERWLSHFFDLKHECSLFMREDGDYRADYIVKREIYKTWTRNEYDVDYIFEDRDQVVDMWRKLGKRCLQVDAGHF